MTEIAMILQRLWTLKRWVVLVALLAVLAGLATVFDVSKLPDLEKRSVTVGVAGAQMLLDVEGGSAIGNVDASIEPLAARTQVLATLSQSAPVARLIAENAGVNPSDVAINNGGGVDAPERGRTIVNELLVDRVVVNAVPNLPMLNISTQAATAERAERLAEATTSALVQYFSQFQQTPGQNRVGARSLELRRVNISRGGLVSSGTSWTKAAVVALGTFLVGCLIVVFLAGLFRELRGRGESEPAAPEARPERHDDETDLDGRADVRDPEVLHSGHPS